MVIELKIDGMTVDIDQKSKIAATHSIADIEEPDGTAAGYSKSLEVPLMSNMRVFRFTNELYSREQFNNELHKAEYIVDGNTVMSGIAQIDKITYEFDHDRRLTGGSFHVSVIGAAYDWITNARRPINELESAETVKYNMEEVYRNSVREDESLIKFFPVDRGAFWKEVAGEKIPRAELDIRDYHPFFNAWRTLRLILSGYTVRSSMAELFKKLYCSGHIPETEDLSYIKEENDFSAGTSLMINEFTVDKSYQDVKLFNKWVPETEDEEYFVATQGILKNFLGHTIFEPTETAPTAFKIKLNFTSSIGANAEFIDTFAFGMSHDKFRFGLIDSDEGKEEYFTKFPENWSGPLLMRLKVKNPADFVGLYSAGYRNGPDWDPGIIEETEFLEPIKEGTYYTWAYPPPLDSPYLYLLKKDRTAVAIDDPEEVELFEAVELDRNNRTISFSVEFTTHSYTVQRSGFALLARFESSAGETLSAKNTLRLSVGTCEIAPEFGSAIGLNDKVGISTIGGTGSQLDFLASLRQMFNLLFYTNPLTREIFVEPRTRFYNLDRAEIVDWREKIDYSKQIEVEELGGDIGNKLKLAYADGNEVVQYYNWKNKTELGAYSVPLLNKTTDETKEIVNGTFAPFLLRTVESVGMTLPQEKRETTQDDIRETDLSITPIIGYFDGLAIRTAGADLNPYSHYPRLLFQDEAKGVNLGFEDITGVTLVRGLRQYYEDNISAYNYGRRITLYLRLTPQDVEPFQFPNNQKQDLRAVFLLNMDGEDVPCVLEEIADYNPASGAATKCVFISDPRIKLTGDDLTVITYDDVAISRNNALTGYR